MMNLSWRQGDEWTSGRSQHDLKNLKLRITESNDQRWEKQFSAITITLNDELKYISFLGTSIIGWKEDFNLSFTEHSCINRSIKMANNMMKKMSNSKIYFGAILKEEILLSTQR